MKKHTGLTDVQKHFITLLAQGLTDKEIVKRLGIGSTSTVRTHRFKLKEKQNLLRDKKIEDDFVSIHKGATMVDERYEMTT